nr:T9SS type A sorting domain-containing protein [Algibacter sp.]
MPLKVRIVDIQNFNENQAIYIHDLETDIFVNLKNQNFEINLESGLYSDRFEITFNNTVLSNSEETISSIKLFQNNRISQLKLLNKNSLEIESFNLYDVSGKLVFSDRIYSSKRKHTFSTKSLSAGIYIAKIELLDRTVFSKKIVVSNKN